MSTAIERITGFACAVNELTHAFDQIKAESPKLVHGMTVKNPTEVEAKMIFDEARRLGVLSKYSKGVCKTFKDICYSNRFEDGSDGVIECVFNSTACAQVTAKEFVQRMQNGRG